MGRKSVGRALLAIMLSILSILSIYPLIWIFINSLKTKSQMYENPWWFSDTLELKNYAIAWTDGRIGRYFINSAIVCALAVVVTVLFSSMATFAITRLKWRLSETVLKTFLLGMMIPMNAVIVPLFIIFKQMNIINNYLSLILPYVVFALPNTIFILSGFFLTYPHELEESAVLDGCSMGRVFWEIILPLAKSPLATVTIFSFVAMYNDLLFASVFLTDRNLMTLPVGMNSFKGRYLTEWTQLFAGVMMAIVPSIAVYVILHERIVEGITAGAVKG